MRKLVAVVIGLLSLAAAFPVQASDQLHLRMIAASRLRHGWRVGTPGSSVTYDTTMGTAVDTNGFTSLPLRAGAHRYYVKNGGSDANTCTQAQSPTTPKATLASAWSCVTAGLGDQVVLAEGSTFAEGLPDFTGKNGFSAQYPTVVSSYNPASPTDETEIGRGDQRSDRPILTVFGGGGPANYIAIKGIELNPPDPLSVWSSGSSIQSIGAQGTTFSYYLIENCLLYNVGLGFDRGTDFLNSVPYYPANPLPVILRNNVVSGGPGLYFSGLHGVTLEDNVLWHVGWRPGAARDDPTTSGGPNGFVHPFYVQSDNVNVTIRRNLIVDGPADAGHDRGDGLVSQNLYIDDPFVISIGGAGNNITMMEGRYNGVLTEVSYNAALGAVNTSSTSPGGGGIDASNGKPGTRIHHNLLAWGVPSSASAQGFSNQVYPGVTNRQPAYAQFDHNVMYNWVTNLTGGYVHTQGDANVAYAHTSYDHNVWDGPATGTNTNATASGSFPNAYTASTFYAALTPTYPSITDKTSFINYVIAHPEAHVQRTGLSLLLTGYGIITPTDTTAPNLTSPTAVATGPNAATLGATTDEGDGILYGELVTQNISASAPPVLNTPTQTTGGALVFSTYHYVVTAVLADGETVASNEVSITPTGTSAAVSLSWSAVAGATEYRLYRSDVSGDENMGFRVPGTSFTDIGAIPFAATPSGSGGTPPTLGAATSSTTGGGLPAGTYYYKVASSLTSSSTSAASNEVSITTTGPSSIVTLSWSTDPSAIGYAVYRGTSPGGENVEVSMPAATAFKDTGVSIEAIVPPGTPYPDQVKLGLDHSGVPGVFVGSQTVASTGAKTVSGSAINPAGTYKAFLVHEDAVGNKSNVVSAGPITIVNGATTWNASTDTPASSADWSLSGDKLTATRTANSGFWGLLYGSAAKSSGTVIYHIVAMSGTFNYVGFATASETSFPGNSNTDQGISYKQDGTIASDGGTVVAGLATYTAGDCIKEVKSGSSFSFYKQTACTGSFVLQTTYDTHFDSANLTGNVYPAAASGNATGTQILADFSGW